MVVKILCVYRSLGCQEATGVSDFPVKVQVQSQQRSYCLPFKQMSSSKAPAATPHPLYISAGRTGAGDNIN